MIKRVALTLLILLSFNATAYAPTYTMLQEDLFKKSVKKKKSTLSYYNKKITKDGLKLEKFIVAKAVLGEAGGMVVCDGNIKVGDIVTVIIKVKNTKKKSLFFKKYGIFVGCRWEYKKGELVNKDFGYCRNVVIGPGKSIFLIAKIRVDKPGIWYFWPAYWLDNHFGPYMWKVKKIKVH